MNSSQVGSMTQVSETASKQAKAVFQQGGLLPSLLPFDRYYSEAISAIYSLEGSNQLKSDKKDKLSNKAGNVEGIESVSPLYAQVPGGVNSPAVTAPPEALNRVPMQLFLDKTVTILERISTQEFRVNDLIEGFVEGQVTEDEVIIETAKFNLQMSMLVSIIQTAIQEFKGIQQIAV